jgi:Uma2 family endonuclease
MITAEAKAPSKRRTQRRWTFAELAAELPESNLPTELWDGELIMSPAPSFFHQEIVLRFYDVLKAWVAPRKLGKVVVAPADMVLAPRRSVQPDVLFVSKQRCDIIDARVNGPADLVAEVVSPEFRRRDRIDKRDLYEQHGIREFWLLDPEAETVEVFVLPAGEYRLLGRWRPGETARSEILKGFSVSVGKLFKDEF